MIVHFFFVVFVVSVGSLVVQAKTFDIGTQFVGAKKVTVTKAKA